jgi:hypothetical protein
MASSLTWGVFTLILHNREQNPMGISCCKWVMWVGSWLSGWVDGWMDGWMDVSRRGCFSFCLGDLVWGCFYVFYNRVMG